MAVEQSLVNKMYNEKIAVIGDEDTVVGFRLAGITTAAAVTEETAESEFNKMLADNTVGIIIVQDDMARGFSHRTKKTIESIAKPVIVTVPGKKELTKGEKSGSIAEMVKRAIGIELKT